MLQFKYARPSACISARQLQNSAGVTVKTIGCLRTPAATTDLSKQCGWLAQRPQAPHSLLGSRSSELVRAPAGARTRTSAESSLERSSLPLGRSLAALLASCSTFWRSCACSQAVPSGLAVSSQQTWAGQQAPSLQAQDFGQQGLALSVVSSSFSFLSLAASMSERLAYLRSASSSCAALRLAPMAALRASMGSMVGSLDSSAL